MIQHYRPMSIITGMVTLNAWFILSQAIAAEKFRVNIKIEGNRKGQAATISYNEQLRKTLLTNNIYLP